MKKFLKKLGFHKMDEMEQYIAFKAQGYAYHFLMASLIVWIFIDARRTIVHHTPLNLIPSALSAIALNINTISQLIMKRRAVKDDDENMYEISSLVTIIFEIILTVVLVGLVVAIIMIK